MAYGHNVPEQVLKPFGCAFAIPAHSEKFAASSCMIADPLMGVERGIEDGRHIRQGWLRRGDTYDDN